VKKKKKIEQMHFYWFFLTFYFLLFPFYFVSSFRTLEFGICDLDFKHCEGIL